jgi:hypothetical protein
VTWVFFRSETPAQAFGILRAIVTDFDAARFTTLDHSVFASSLLGLALLLAFELGVLRRRGFEALHPGPRGGWVAAGWTLFFFGGAVLFGNALGGQFIYFQF